MAGRVRGICALDRADRDVAAAGGEALVLWRRRFRAGGSRVLHVRSANRDEACFKNPDNFDITRDTQKSIAFGAGPHYCAGAFASRAMVADAALPGIFKRLKGLRLDGAEPVRIGGWAFRGLLNVPGGWEAE